MFRTPGFDVEPKKTLTLTESLTTGIANNAYGNMIFLEACLDLNVHQEGQDAPKERAFA